MIELEIVLAGKTTQLIEIQLQSSLIKKIKQSQIKDCEIEDKIEVSKRPNMVMHSGGVIRFKGRLTGPNTE